MTVGLVVRPERPEDAEAIRRVHGTAFSAGGMGDGAGEAALVDALREGESWVPGLSLVAELDGQVVGHLLFTRVAVVSAEGEVEILSLAPIAVLPGYEGTYAGTRLIRHGLAECLRLGFPAVVVLGHPKYYRRFGFRPAAALGVRSPFAAPDAAWTVLELSPGALARVRGIVRYPAAFDAVT